jgi:hypothetical protein
MDSAPYILLLIVLIAVVATIGLSRMGRKAGAQPIVDKQDSEVPQSKDPELPAPPGLSHEDESRAPPVPGKPPVATPASSMRVVDKVSSEELEDEDEPAPIAPPKKVRGGRPSEGDILKVLSSLPRGLPSTLWGMEIEELASEVSRGEYRKTADDELLVKVRNKWYFGDPKDIGTYLQLYRGK